MKYSWEIKTYESWAEVDDPKFISEWELLINTSAISHIFVHPKIIKTWTDIYRQMWDISPLYILAKCEGVTVFFPLIIWRKNWKSAAMKVVIPAGYKDFDYHDPIINKNISDSMIASFYDAVNQNLFLNKTVDYDEVDLFGIQFRGSNNNWEEEESCPYADLTKYNDFDDFSSQISKKLLKDIQRSRRMLSELGSLNFHVYKENELQDAINILPLVLENHKNKWPNLIINTRLYELLIKNSIPSGLIHFSEIRIGDKPISWHLCFRYKQKNYGYMQVYLPEYSKYSLGKVHLLSIIEDCFNDGVKIFDFMRGSEEYKNLWTNSDKIVYEYRHFSKRPMSIVKLRANEMIQKYKHRLSINK
jgi:CelD/BcsL family acetyltransferase involved in cellulose biosynthesis